MDAAASCEAPRAQGTRHWEIDDVWARAIDQPNRAMGGPNYASGGRRLETVSVLQVGTGAAATSVQ
jgi:hypothetical protein